MEAIELAMSVLVCIATLLLVIISFPLIPQSVPINIITYIIALFIALGRTYSDMFLLRETEPVGSTEYIAVGLGLVAVMLITVLPLMRSMDAPMAGTIGVWASAVLLLFVSYLIEMKSNAQLDMFNPFATIASFMMMH